MNKFPLPSTERLVGWLKPADSAAPSTRAPYPTFPAYSVSCEVVRSSLRRIWGGDRCGQEGAWVWGHQVTLTPKTNCQTNSLQLSLTIGFSQVWGVRVAE